MNDSMELVKIIIKGEVYYVTPEEAKEYEEHYRKVCYVFPHTDKSRKEYKKA